MDSSRSCARRAPMWWRAVRVVDYVARATVSWRVGVALSWVLGALFVGMVVFLGVRGEGGGVDGVVARAWAVVAWVCGGIVAWWWAADGDLWQRRAGLADIVAAHGVAPVWLRVARPLVAGWRVGVVMAWGTLPVALATCAVSPTLAVALGRAVGLLVWAAYCVFAGQVLGWLSVACGWLSPKHGRLWLAAVVVLPWALQSALMPQAGPWASVPAVLGAIARAVSKLGAGL